jgi:Na+-transporting methylmalonyl-CoA/oxaloacetate decarboxylase gamma subunit
MKRVRPLWSAAAGAGFLSPAAQACVTCFGRSDSPLAEGMNMGILFLLGVVLAVLAALACFFVYLGRRSVAAAQAEAPAPANASDSPTCKT